MVLLRFIKNKIKMKEFPTKFWVILGVTLLFATFAILAGAGVIEVGAMGVRF